jgi:hypothetical protein
MAARDKTRRQFPQSRSDAVTTLHGMQMLRDLFMLAIFAPKRVFTGLHRKRWSGHRITTSFDRRNNGERAYTHARY